MSLEELEEMPTQSGAIPSTEHQFRILTAINYLLFNNGHEFYSLLFLLSIYSVFSIHICICALSRVTSNTENVIY